MEDHPPILNYRRPRARRPQLPIGQRCLFGVTATAVALLATALLLLGLIFAVGLGEWHDLLPGLFFAAIAYVLWLPVRPQRRRW